MKIIVTLIVGIILFCPIFSKAQNENWTSARPDGHAPISFMGDHYHHQGQVMLSYRFMPMWMKGNLSSSDKISDNEIYQMYMVAPQKMTSQMHMLGIMYAPVDAFTLMAMVNYVSKEMDLKTKTGVDFKTNASGLGDISLTGLIKIFNNNRQSLHANVSLSLPTGSIDQKDDMPTMKNAQLAYPMQLGSGTCDPSVGGTYVGQTDDFSWGVQAIYKFRIGENKRNYTLGNELNSAAWCAIKTNDYLSFSGSLNYKNMEKIKGADSDLNPMMMPLFNTANSGRNELDLGIGSNFYVPGGSWKDFRVAVQVNFPVIQSVTGIQMKNTVMGTLGIQYTLQ